VPNSVEIVVISLSTATERRQKIADQFKSLPHDWSFFDAHRSLLHEDLTCDEADLLRHTGRKFSVPQLAVWSSHYTVIKNFLECSQSEYLLVFEDDVVFDTDFPISKAVDLCAQKNIDYIRLYGMYYAPAEKLGYFYDRGLIRYKSSPCGMQAYILSKNGAKKFTDKTRKVEATVDLAIDYFWRTKLPIYAIFPFPVIERYSPSSIPIFSESPLNLRDKLIVSSNRIVNKLAKIRENVRLRRSDGEFKRSSMPFQQVNLEDMDRK
jgi:glycosyl transferase, family 25